MKCIYLKGEFIVESTEKLNSSQFGCLSSVVFEEALHGYKD